MGLLSLGFCLCSFPAFFLLPLLYRRLKNTTTVSFGDSEGTFEVSVKTNSDVRRTTFKSIVEERCKSLFTEFKPVWYLPNGHLQTMYCVAGDFSHVDAIEYERVFLRHSEGGTIGLDFAPTEAFSMNDNTPILVVQHGLTGGSYEAYVRAVVVPAIKPVEEGGLGYRAVIVNFRGCAGVKVTSRQLYSAGYTGDLRVAVRYLRHRFPKARLVGLGFSLGANVLTRYLAEEGNQSALSSGCAVGCPWNLAKNNDGLNNSLIGRRLYSKAMGANLSRLVQRHEKALRLDPAHPVAKATEAVLALKNPTIEEFDDIFTCIAGGPAPRWPYKNAYAYYNDNSSHGVVKDVCVPFLGINATDDPIVTDPSIQWKSHNKKAVFAMTSHGGHLGWFQSQTSSEKLGRWFTRPVLEWLKLTGEEIIPENTLQSRRIYVDEDGWLRQEGEDKSGVKEIDGGGLIDGTEQDHSMTQGL